MYEEDSNDGMVFLWMWFIVAIYGFIGNITTNRKMGLSKEYIGVTIFLGVLAVALGYLLLVYKWIFLKDMFINL